MNTADTARLILSEATVLAIDIEAALRALDQAQSGWPTSTSMAGPSEPGQTPDYTGRCNEPAIAHQRLTRCPNPWPCATHPAAGPDTDGNCTHVEHIDCPEHAHATGSLEDGPCDHPRPCPVHDTNVKLTTPEAGATRTDDAQHALDQLRKAIREAHRNTRLAADIAHSWSTIRIDDTSVRQRLAMVDSIWCSNCALHGFSNPRRQGGTVCEYCAQFKSRYPKYKTYPPKAILEIWTTRGKVLEADVHRVMRDLKANAKQVKRDLDKDWKAKKPDPARTIESEPDALAQRRTKRLTA